MAATKLSLAQFAIKTATKNYLSGVAFAVAFRMQGMVKSVEARDLIDKAAGEVDAVTAKAIKSLTQAISNQWNFGGEVMAKFTPEERKAINACGDNGMMERIIAAMQAHMQHLGFNDFTLGNLREYYGFNSAAEIEEHKAMMAEKEAEAAAKAEAEAATQAAQTAQAAVTEAEAQAVAAGKPERNITEEAKALLATANVEEMLAVIEDCTSRLGNNAIVAAMSAMLALPGMGLDEYRAITAVIDNRKAAIAAHNQAAEAQAKLDAERAKPSNRKAA